MFNFIIKNALFLALVPLITFFSSLSAEPPLRGSFTSIILVNDADSDGLVSHGDTITSEFFPEDPTRDLTGVQVSTQCIQNNAIVLEQSHLLINNPFPGSEQITLNAPAWSSGSADCTIDIIDFHDNGKVRKTKVPTFNFFVNP